MKIAVIGSGYVGLVTGACLADFGHEVICMDDDREKIARLRGGRIPVHEPGLDEVVARNARENRLQFTADPAAAIQAAKVIFIAVGTPSLANGEADSAQVEACAKTIAINLEDYKVIAIKSTVPVGTAKRVREIIEVSLRSPVPFDVVSNPEFLREGSAIYDFTHPDRIVIGAETGSSAAIMREVYRNLYLIDTPFVITNLETSELIKYASNAFLAIKIAFINEMANLCEAVGADIRMVAKAVGLDGRIGPKFLHAGPGYGGSCFPKDTRALAMIARSHGEKASIIETVIEANEGQKRRMVGKIERAVGGLAGKVIAVLGLSFKPNTDDIRESPSIFIIESMLAAGATVRAHDPEAMGEAAAALAGDISFCDDPYEAVSGADAVAIITEWNQYRRLDLPRLRRLLRRPIFLDLRNIYTAPEAESAGLIYHGVGQAAATAGSWDEAAAARDSGIQD